MLLNISILNTFILHTQKIIHKPVGSVWKQLKWKTILERNSIQSSSLHKHENTIIWFSLIPMGGGKSYPSWYFLQWPYRIIIYMAQHLNHSLITLTKKGLLSNISTKMQNFQPKASSKAQQTVLLYKIYFKQVINNIKFIWRRHTTPNNLINKGVIYTSETVKLELFLILFIN